MLLRWKRPQRGVRRRRGGGGHSGGPGVHAVGVDERRRHSPRRTGERFGGGLERRGRGGAPLAAAALAAWDTEARRENRRARLRQTCGR